MRGNRLFKLIWILLGVIAVLVARMVQLQVIEHDTWAERARRSRLEKRTLPAERGRILDREGRVLAQDRRSFDLYFEYRSFRRGQLVGQLVEVFHLMAEPCGGLMDCLAQGEQLGERMFAWTPADMKGLGSRSLGDIQFYLRKLAGIESKDREKLEQWMVAEHATPFGVAFPEARPNFLQELQLSRNRFFELQMQIGQRLKLPLLERLEEERKKLELRIRQEAVRVAASNALQMDPWDVRILFQVHGKSITALDVQRHFAIEELIRRWQWGGTQEDLARIMESRPGNSVSLKELGQLLGQVEQLLPQDLAGVRRDLTARVHRDRIVRLVRGVEFEVVDLLGLQPAGYSGLYIQSNSNRVYPDPLAPQLVGSVRIAAEDDLEEYLDKKAQLIELGRLLFRSKEQEAIYRALRDEFLRVLMRPGETRGLDGVEGSFESVLRGERGYLRLLLSVGEEEGQPQELEFVPPINGKEVQLSLSASLLEAAERAIPDAYRTVRENLAPEREHARPYLKEPRVGFALIDLKDGTVPVLATWPTYKREDLRESLDEYMSDRSNNVFRQRALGGGYDGFQTPYPGSTFKLVIAVEALVQDPLAWNRKIYCPNQYLPRGVKAGPRVKPLKCMNHSAREIDMHDAIMLSCNTYFYTLATELGWDRIWRRSRQLGFGSPTGIELIPIKKTRLDKEKREGEYDDGWRYEASGPNRFLEQGANFLKSRNDEFHAFTMAHFGIGQVSVQASPLQMARFYGWLSTGRLLTPKLMLRSGGGAPAVPPEPEIPLDPGIRRLLMGAMKDVIADPAGTANDPLYPLEQFKVAGKTGTAQTGRTSPNHGWFVGYFPWDKPRYSFAILCENVELHGGEIANLILYKFLQSEEARAFFAKAGI